MDNFGSGGGSETSAESLARFHRAGLGYQCPGRNSALPSSGKNPKCYRFLRRAGTTAHITKRPAKATIPRIASSGNGVPPVSHRQAGGTAITAAAPPNHPPRPTSIVAMIRPETSGIHNWMMSMWSCMTSKSRCRASTNSTMERSWASRRRGSFATHTMPMRA